jgi:thioredoxin-like negative regulator of GroEL
MKALAPKHLETKFCKIDATKCPFLTDRLKIRVIPTIGVFKAGQTRDYIVGFTDLGNTDEFTTEMLEWRLAQSDIINYSGDLMTPPEGKEGAKKKINIMGGKKTKSVRGNTDYDSSDNDDW